MHQLSDPSVICLPKMTRLQKQLFSSNSLTDLHDAWSCTQHHCPLRSTTIAASVTKQQGKRHGQSPHSSLQEGNEGRHNNGFYDSIKCFITHTGRYMYFPEHVNFLARGITYNIVATFDSLNQSPTTACKSGIDFICQCKSTLAISVQCAEYDLSKTYCQFHDIGQL